MLRINYIDHMKALGIILVVLGHAAWLNENIYILIYSFHMPLFFFMSGYLASRQYSIKEALIKLNHRLIIPFGFFFFVSFCFWLPLHFFGSGQASNMPWFDPLSRLITAQADSFHINGVLWFFPCLIVISVLQIIIFSKMKPITAFIISAVILSFLLVNVGLIKTRFYWCFDSALVGLFFFQMGRVAKESGLLNSTVLSKKYFVWILLLILLPIFYIAALQNGRVDMRELSFGVIPFLYPLISCLGIFILFLICSLLKASPTSRLLALSSIAIFPLHLIIFRFLNKFQLMILDSTSVMFSVLPYFNSLLAIVICIFVFNFLKKRAPSAIGL
ncbi:acyltransferase family protein [Pseudoalteromonas aliena]|uniref:Acyltransferase 3 domain-containing protein n=1 Tax=Pseudoalteromonas aliena SW19 TaxID=1314866 RepID=A0ABR9DZ77_9GAMM|nr:acyltransferase family protein [Pseudoalteromonas aliena]MBE0359503.1 hypothetical protein [Pseudoalteromonas aliena SW19]